MNTALSLPQTEDQTREHMSRVSTDSLDTLMLKVARNLAMDMQELPDILDMLGIEPQDFEQWKSHPRFNQYLISEKEAWNSAMNAHERTKLKASTVMEEFMVEAYKSLHNPKHPLNHRVELGKLVAKIAGMGEPKIMGGAGGGFSLQINIGPGRENQVNITGTQTPVIDHDIDHDADYDAGWNDDYDPLTSPDSLDGSGGDD